MLIELDIYSGRPNPRWEVDGEAESKLRRLLDGLALATTPPPEPPGLGYRGFVFGNSRAYRGHVAAGDALLADPDRSVERFMLERLPPELAELRPRLERELTSSTETR